MQLTKFSISVVFSVIFMAPKSGGEIVLATSSLDDANSIVLRDLTNIVSTCYGGRIDAVGVAGHVPAALLRTLSVQHSIPVTLINGTKEHIKDTDWIQVHVKLRRKLAVFIVETESWREVKTIIKNIKKTIWWNHMASFFIIHRSLRCNTGMSLLYEAWLNNLLHAKVLCFYQGRTTILSYNPYKSEAPHSWRQIGSTRGRRNHPFTVFYQMYPSNEKLCVDLDFDKTKDTAGYPINIEGRYDNVSLFLPNHTFAIKLITTSERIWQTVFRAINATPEYWGVLDYDGHLYEDLRRLYGSMRGTWNKVKSAYPHGVDECVIISRFRGHKTQLEKILDVIDVNSRIGLVVVYMITLMFLKFFVRQALAPALLNLVRITCNTSFANLDNNNSSRIYITALLFFVVTIQGIYQGNLAALLTQTIPLRDPNTLQDLVDLDYKKIYADAKDNLFVNYPALMERAINVEFGESLTCIENANRDLSAACIGKKQGVYLDSARVNKMHVSNGFSPVYTGFWIRWDWPLEDRFNIILSRLVEAHVLEPWNVTTDVTAWTEFEFDEEVRKNKSFKKIEFSELRFAFVILGIGLACSTITFIIELTVHRFQSRSLRVRSMYPRGIRALLP